MNGRAAEIGRRMSRLWLAALLKVAAERYA